MSHDWFISVKGEFVGAFWEGKDDRAGDSVSDPS